jgi:hypothetical protein
MPNPPEIQQLLDEQAIHNVLLDYCHALDRCDADGVRAAFFQDATVDYGLYAGAARDFADWGVSFLRENYLSHMHVLSNIRLSIEGDVARSESYMTPVLRRKDAGGETLDCSGGRYIDRLERRFGKWKIAHRIFVREWREARAVLPLENASDKYRWGVRSKQDPSYFR